jgi:hypothetical protein
MQTITVTQDQFSRIEAAWEICCFGNSRKATGAWAREQFAKVVSAMSDAFRA